MNSYSRYMFLFLLIFSVLSVNMASAAWTSSLTENLTTYLTMDDTSGNPIDSTDQYLFSSENLTYSNDGIIGTSINFTRVGNNLGSQVYNNTGDPLGITDYPFSFNLWVRTDTTQEVENGLIFLGNSDASYSSYGLGFYGSNNIKMNAVYDGGAESELTDSGVDIVTGNWTMLSAVFASAIDRKLYINGVSVANATTSVQFLVSSFQIGGENNNANTPPEIQYPYTGSVDEVGVWDRELTITDITQLYNSGTGITYTTYVSNITLNSPSSANYTTPQNIVMNYTASDYVNLTSVKLYVNDVLNQTNSSGINNSVYLFDLSLGDGDYTIYANVTNNNSEVVQSESIRIFIDSTHPQINVQSPNGTIGYNYVGGNQSFNVSFTDTNLDSCWYNYNGTNTTIDGCLTGVYNLTNITIETGNTNMTVYSNDTLGNENNTFIDWDYTYFENNRTHNTTSYESSSETFSINVEGASSVALIYNGTSYTTTKSGNTFSKTLQIPLYKLGNNTVYFKFNSAENSYTSYQNVSAMNFSICDASFTTIFLNITFKDEGNSSRVDAEIPTSTFDYWLGDGSVYKTYTYSNNTENSYYTFCATPNLQLTVDELVQYKSTGYPQRIYDQESVSLTNETTNTTLYLLSNADGIYVTFQVYSGQYDALQDVAVTSTRLIGGITSTMAQGTTDAAGSVTFWLNPDFLHTNTFIKSGYTTTILSIFPTQSLYTITMGSGVSSNVTDYAEDIVETIAPSGTFLDANTFYDFVYTISSDTLDLSEYGINLSYVNGTSISIQTGSTSTGGALSYSFNTSNNTKLIMDYYYIVNSTRVNGSRHYVIFQTNDYSLYHFFNRVSTYISADIFGIQSDDEGYFSKAMISILILIMVSGTISYRYGLGSEAAVTGIIFGVVFMLNMFDFIPTPDFITFINLGDFIVVFIALISIGMIIKEETR